MVKENLPENEGTPVCEKCGSLMIEEEGEWVCPNCDGEIDFLGDEDE
jgi:rubrerythrin